LRSGPAVSGVRALLLRARVIREQKGADCHRRRRREADHDQRNRGRSPRHPRVRHRADYDSRAQRAGLAAGVWNRGERGVDRTDGGAERLPLARPEEPAAPAHRPGEPGPGEHDPAAL